MTVGILVVFGLHGFIVSFRQRLQLGDLRKRLSLSLVAVSVCIGYPLHSESVDSTGSSYRSALSRGTVVSAASLPRFLASAVPACIFYPICSRILWWSISLNLTRWTP